MASSARFKVVPAGRRSGKTELAKLVLSLVSMNCYDPRMGIYRVRHNEAPRYFAAAPTLTQARRIYWDDLKRLVPKWALACDPRESDMIITLKTGAMICVLGMDVPERIEGAPWDGGILDEYGNMKAKAWGSHVRPALSTLGREGWCWLIGVPEGRNHYYDRYKAAVACTTNEWAGFTWKSSEVLSAGEIAAAKADLDELTYLQEYEASFVNFTGRAYYGYSDANVGSLSYDPRQPLVFCFDFNVAPGVAAVIQEQALPGQFETISTASGIVYKAPVVGTGIIGEVWIPQNSNTPAVCRKLIADWGSHQGDVIIYGDATGGSRGSAKVQGSDWDLIKAAFALSPLADKVRYRVRSHNPAERSRLNAVNSRIRSASGVVRLMVDRTRAPHVDADFDGVRLLDGGSGEIDKKHDPKLTHLCFSGNTIVETDSGFVKMSDLPRFGKIRTWDGSFERFNNPGKRGTKPVVEVLFSDGKSVVCTPDHLFLTEKGWVEAVDSSGLLCYDWLSHESGSQKCKKLFSRERNTAGTGNTIQQAKKDCTLLCGNRKTERFQADTAFTTSMKIVKTTGLRILQCSGLANTWRFTCRTQEEKRRPPIPCVCRTFGQQQQNGTQAKTECVGTLSMRKEFSDLLKRSSMNALFAEKSIFQEKRKMRFFAQGLVRQKLAEEAVLMTLKRHAVCAESASRQTSITQEKNARYVVSVSPAGVADVYCPTVPYSGCFALENGVIVSNSDGCGYYIEQEFPVSGTSKVKDM